MLQVRSIDGNDHLLAICDHCHEIIRGGDEGNFSWQTLADGSTSQVWHTHKECQIAFEDSRPGDYWLSLDLASLPVHLGLALGVDLAQQEVFVGYTGTFAPPLGEPVASA